MTQPHYIDLKPCPVCGEGALECSDYVGGPAFRVYCENPSCWVDGPLSPTRAEAVAAWNRREAPMEAVAWQVREQPGTAWVDTQDPEFWRERGWQVQALAVIPTEGLGSSAEGADTHRVAETAVVAELQELREAASDVIKMLDLQLIAARHNNARGDHQWEPAGSTIERLRAAIKIGGRNDRP